MKLVRLLALSLFAAVAAVGCDDDDDGTGPDGQTALVRIVNATNNVPDLNVVLSGSTTPLLTQSLAARGSSASCVTVPAGNQTYTFRSGNTDLLSSGFNFQAGRRYTMFLSNSGANRIATVVEDNQTPAASDNALRAFNGSATPGDVYVFTAGGSMGTPAFGNLAVVGTSNTGPNYVNRATAQNTVRFYNVGTTTGTPRAELTLPTLTSRVGTIVFVEAGSPAGPTAFVVQPCP